MENAGNKGNWLYFTELASLALPGKVEIDTEKVLHVELINEDL